MLAATRHSLPSLHPCFSFPVCGTDVHHKRVGIVGLGRIGEAIARRFKGFDCSIAYTGRSGAKPEVEAALGGATWLPLPELLSTSDIVVLICPLTPETRGMIAAPQLALLKDGAVLINAARGECVVQADLVAALAARPSLRAGLDVTDPEPLPLDHALLQLPNALAGLEGADMPAEVPETLAASAAWRAAL